MGIGRRGEAREAEAVLDVSEVTLVELEVSRFSNVRQYRDGFRAVPATRLSLTARSVVGEVGRR
jgi:hypothetical protein